jgi:hypothetical protein
MKTTPRYTHVQVGHRAYEDDSVTIVGIRSDGVVENVGYVIRSGTTYHHWTSSDSTKQYRANPDVYILDQVKEIMRARGELKIS